MIVLGIDPGVANAANRLSVLAADRLPAPRQVAGGPEVMWLTTIEVPARRA